MNPRPLFAVALALPLAACGSSPDSTASEPEPVAQVAPANEATRNAAETPKPEAESQAAGPAVPPMDDEPESGALTTPPIEPPATPEDEAPVPAPEADEDAGPEPAELGRPDWWFSEVRRTEERVTVCAEAGGPTVREARRAAIAAAREKLDRALGRVSERETVSMAMVLPLPAADAGPGAARYIGYVMMEARQR